MSTKKDKKSKKESTTKSKKRRDEPEPLDDDLDISSEPIVYKKKPSVETSTMDESPKSTPQEILIVGNDEVNILTAFKPDVNKKEQPSSSVYGTFDKANTSLVEEVNEIPLHEEYINIRDGSENMTAETYGSNTIETGVHMETSFVSILDRIAQANNTMDFLPENKSDIILYGDAEEDKSSYLTSSGYENLAYNEDLPTYEQENTLAVYLCNEHGTSGVFRPSTVVVAQNNEEAYELLEMQLSRRGYPCMNEKKYRLFRIDLRKKQAIMLCAEELQETEMLPPKTNSMKVWLCVNHDILSPISAASVIVSNDRQSAIALLDAQLLERNLRDSNEMPYTLKELSTTEPSVYILSHGAIGSNNSISSDERSKKRTFDIDDDFY